MTPETPSSAASALSPKLRGLLLNNASWCGSLTLVEFLRDVGKHFTVNMMLGKDSVKSRLEDREHGISYTEFSYMLLQAYDFYILNRDYDCSLQLGGSDQWGNITAGTDLIRRMKSAATDFLPTEAGTPSNSASSGPPRAAGAMAPAYGLTHPLIMKADGTKFGKSEKGSVWLDPARTSPYQFYQFFLQTSDADVITLLNLLSFVPVQEIKELQAQVATAPEHRLAQRRLAEAMTEFVHGLKELHKAQAVTQALFTGDLHSLDNELLAAVLLEAPHILIPRDRLALGVPLIELLVESELAASKGAARKDIIGGGISLDQKRVSDQALIVSPSLLLKPDFFILQKGKKSRVVVKISG